MAVMVMVRVYHCEKEDEDVVVKMWQRKMKDVRSLEDCCAAADVAASDIAYDVHSSHQLLLAPPPLVSFSSSLTQMSLSILQMESVQSG